MREQELLAKRLEAYGKGDVYPFHMPGHKRLQEAAWAEGMDFPNPFRMDITEIEGFDNLHHPEGILKESMDWAAGIYGADRTWYLVNGSTSGILAAVAACVGYGKKILMARNCHKAAYHSLYLNGLESVYVYPPQIPGLGIQGGILPQDVEKQLEVHSDIQAVLMVSPTYDGIVSDIHTIAQIAHRKKIPLIVDEAHGAHFHFDPDFPDSALDLGADLVIQSVHKTLPSLTQTAVLHMKENRQEGGPFVDEKRLEFFLQIYQTSSPSYVLMASIENSIFQMNRFQTLRRETGGGPLSEYSLRLKEIRGKLKNMKHLKLLDGNLRGSWGIWDVDPGKILVSGREAGLSGRILQDRLRDEYHLEMEMCGADYVTAITSVMDSQQGFDRLCEGLLEMDRKAERSVQGEMLPSLPALPQKMTVRQALDQPCDRIRLEELQGKTVGEFIYVYPPGIPIAAPGEQMTPQALELIQRYIRLGLPVQGPGDDRLEMIKTVKG